VAPPTTKCSIGWCDEKFIDSYREGYCEYVAGGSTLDYESGVKLWKANPNDGTGYQYFKYYLTVKNLLETDKVTVEDLFNRDIDQTQVEGKIFSTL
jgi:hypothetical protein